MKRIAVLSAVLTVLLGIDGIYMVATKYKGEDVNKFNLSDGGTVVAAAVLMLIITIVAAVLVRRSSQQGE
ncbi:MAG: hypothetical protein JWR03_2249 [Cohnella sp.]|jgi:uncharacterized membrane protein|nr:hypothetical protein [Cohnella sp.]